MLGLTRGQRRKVINALEYKRATKAHIQNRNDTAQALGLGSVIVRFIDFTKISYNYTDSIIDNDMNVGEWLLAVAKAPRTAMKESLALFK